MNSEKHQNASYPRGACPDARRFALAMQLALLQRALAPWPRRHSPLLEVNCGNGAFLQFLWQCGFDAQGSEEDEGLRLRARKRQVPGLEIFAAPADDLPFEDDSFDWVIIHLKTGAKEGIAVCASEGARLARRGMMITFWNSVSLPALSWRAAHKMPWIMNAVPWWVVWRQINRLELGRVSTYSTLVAPVCGWRRQWRFGGVFSGLPIGAWCAIRLDLGPATPLTPLPLRIGARLRQADPVMEYSSKRTATNSKKTDTP